METYGWDETVLVYSDDEKIIKLVNDVTRELKLKCYEAEIMTDVYAIPYFFGVLDPEKLEEGYFKVFKELWDAMNPREFAIHFTKLPTDKIPKNLKRYFIICTDPLDYQQLKLNILNRHRALMRHQKNDRSYDKKLFRLFYILRKLSPQGGMVYLNDLCQEFNVSEKTIKRDIELLRTYGEDIQYDSKKKEYFLFLSQNGISRSRD